MPKPLLYVKYDPDVFMLFCRAETPVQEMPEHPVIAELDDRLDETREIDPRVTGYPHGPLTKPGAWRGFFTIGSCRFRVKSIYAFPKFFGIICDTEEGTHSETDVRAFVDDVNAAVSAELGLDGLR